MSEKKNVNLGRDRNDANFRTNKEEFLYFRSKRWWGSIALALDSIGYAYERDEVYLFFIYFLQ